MHSKPLPLKDTCYGVIGRMEWTIPQMYHGKGKEVGVQMKEDGLGDEKS